MPSSRPDASLPEHVVDAAAWVAHLHGDQRTPDSDRGLQLWLKEDPRRARVWEVTTEVWDEVGALQGAAIAHALRARRAVRQARQRRKLYAVAACVSALLATAVFFLRDARIATGVGEQRMMTLEDGTRALLNTDTRLIVRYDGRERRVELTAGEALFDVARHSGRPFVVEVGGREVRALGTAFVVRRDADRTAVTLTEGMIAVERAGVSTRMTPGERATFVGTAPVAIDHPELERVTAWTRGQVILEGAVLQEAVAEMNRYSASKVSFVSPRAAQLRISGLFRCGDSLSFAYAVAATYGLKVVEKRNHIQLAGEPRDAYRPVAK